MKFLLAPNAMKGALTAQKIAAILAKTLRRRFPEAELLSHPVADGGNGTLECLMGAYGGTVYEIDVAGPLAGQRVTGRLGITAQNIAVIESADACGLHLLAPSPEGIAGATTYGVGELMMEAARRGCTSILLGLGGSGTNDGGAGMLQSLGYSLQDEHGEELRGGNIPLLQLHRIIPPSQPMLTIPVTVLCDVRNPLLGPDGATAVFARQKGAAEEQLPYLESALHNLTEVIRRDIGIVHPATPGSGAAGGLGFGLLVTGQATVTSGIDLILDAVKFDDALAACDIVITTEGMLDAQTLSGKGIAGIAQRAEQHHTPVHAFVGRIAGDPPSLCRTLGLASLTAISPEDLDTQQAMRDASWLLADALFHHPF